MINNFSNDFFKEREDETEQRWREKEKKLIQHEQEKRYNSAIDPEATDIGNLPNDPQTDLSFNVDDIKINI